MSDLETRALGALYGLAVGDALGMPTQLPPRRKVGELFPVLDGFREGPPENEVSGGREAGRVTDDTEQALVVAEALWSRETAAWTAASWSRVCSNGLEG